MSDSEQTSWEEELKEFNRQLIAAFRANGGQVGDRLVGAVADAPILLLTTTGAKSGQPRVSPLIYTTDGGRYVIIASAGGGPINPNWYHNLRANPEVTVETGTESFKARAAVADSTERRRLFDQMAAQVPNFTEYEKKTTREMPVVVLERAG